jgi:large conductance mechanosensitive channel
MLKEFREFALKGNMVDLAIGVIIGAAFGGLVQSIVNDVLMPLIGLVTGGIDFSQMYWQLTGASQATLDQAKETGATIAYGHFITLAINFLIVASFSGLVQSLVNDIVMPIIGLITGGIDFSEMYIQMSGEPQPTLALAREAGATLAYGNFITLVINFVIVAWVLFLIVKAMNQLKREKAAEPEAPKAPSREEVLLEEIRDLLARKS